MRAFILLLLLGALAVGGLWLAQFDRGPVIVTRQDQFKIVRLLGDTRQIITDPGISLRIPWLEEVTVYSKRLQYLDVPQEELQIANNERLIVDFYAIWRIVEPLEFLKAFPTGMHQAENRIEKTITSAAKNQVARLTVDELLSRAAILGQLSEETSRELARDGVEIVDVRISRTEVPTDTEEAAFQQMREQRNAVSRKHRAVGQRQAREIRAQAEREARTLVAKAISQSEVTKGQGDAEAAAVYAKAYGRDPAFYAFVRSLEAYAKTLDERTMMVMAPDHEFFRFLQPEAAIAPRRPTPRPAPSPEPAPSLEPAPSP